jgi:hypothetical protein
MNTDSLFSSSVGLFFVWGHKNETQTGLGKFTFKSFLI